MANEFATGKSKVGTMLEMGKTNKDMLSYGLWTHVINEFKLLNSEFHRKDFSNRNEVNVISNTLANCQRKGRDEKGIVPL